VSCTSGQSSFKEVAGLTALYATGADGVRRMWRVAGGEVAAGEWARVNATEPGISFYIDAEGVSLEGVPAEQAGGGVGAGRRLLGVDDKTGAACSDCSDYDWQCGCTVDSDCAAGNARGDAVPAAATCVSGQCQAGSSDGLAGSACSMNTYGAAPRPQSTKKAGSCSENFFGEAICAGGGTESTYTYVQPYVNANKGINDPGYYVYR
jgi:hypothetical protein